MLVTCTGARTITIGVDDLAGTTVRGIVDLALPADVAPEVVEEGVCLVNLDRLVTDQPDAASAQEIDDARDLVRDKKLPPSSACAARLKSLRRSSPCARWHRRW